MMKINYRRNTNILVLIGYVGMTVLVMLSCSSRDRSTIAADLSFESFLKRFGSDSVFQSERIKYPLPYFYYPDDSDELVKREIAKGDWRYVDFTDDSLGETLTEDAFQVVIEKEDAGTVSYSLRGIDNGILITYNFEIINKQWYLVKATDASV